MIGGGPMRNGLLLLAAAALLAGMLDGDARLPRPRGQRRRHLHASAASRRPSRGSVPLRAGRRPSGRCTGSSCGSTRRGADPGLLLRDAPPDRQAAPDAAGILSFELVAVPPADAGGGRAGAHPRPLTAGGLHAEPGAQGAARLPRRRRRRRADPDRCAERACALRAQAIRRGAGSAGAADRVVLDYRDRFLRRKRLTTAGGAALLVDLPETVSLEDGDAFAARGRPPRRRRGRAPSRWSRSPPRRRRWRGSPGTSATATPRPRSAPAASWCSATTSSRTCWPGSAPTLRPVMAPFRPEGGAYGHGRTHGHHHGGAGDDPRRRLTRADLARRCRSSRAWFSPGYPVGAYSYSHGLEWAVEAGLVARPRRPRGLDRRPPGARRRPHRRACCWPPPGAPRTPPRSPSSPRRSPPPPSGTSRPWRRARPSPAPPPPPGASPVPAMAYPVAVGHAARLLGAAARRRPRRSTCRPSPPTSSRPGCG